jgi:hypothetical protein
MGFLHPGHLSFYAETVLRTRRSRLKKCRFGDLPALLSILDCVFGWVASVLCANSVLRGASLESQQSLLIVYSVQVTHSREFEIARLPPPPPLSRFIINVDRRILSSYNGVLPRRFFRKAFSPFFFSPITNQFEWRHQEGYPRILISISCGYFSSDAHG